MVNASRRTGLPCSISVSTITRICSHTRSLSLQFTVYSSATPPLCFRYGSIQSWSRRGSHDVPGEPSNELPSLHRIVISSGPPFDSTQPLECRWRRWTSLGNVCLALQSKHPQDAKAGLNHCLLEAFLSGEVGDNARIKLG